MTERTQQSDPQSTLFSDSDMDEMLRAFFRMEMPRTFQPPAQRQPGMLDSSEQTLLTIPRPDRSESSAGRRDRRGWVMAMTLAVLAFSVVLLVSDQPHTTTPVAGKVKSQRSTPSDAGSLMLVSPNGESAQTERPVSEDGLLLKETEQIELSPQPND